MLLPLLLALQDAPAPQVTLPEGAALTEAVAAADAKLFATFFTQCDPPSLGRQITSDFEMFHDKAGYVAATGPAFVEIYRKDCEAKKAPDAWRSRRELVRESLHVEPVPGWGAIEEGEHLFYERKGDGAEHLAGRARFVHLWQLAPDGWRLARVVSFSHRKAE